MPSRCTSACCLRRDLALEPDEAALPAEPLAQLGGVEVGHHGGQQLDRLVDVDDAARLGEQRRRLDVGREDFAVAVENIGARGRDRVCRSPAPRRMTVGRDREDHELRRDDAVDDGEAEHGEAEPRLGLAVAVDVAAVEQRLDDPAMPRHDPNRASVLLGRERGCRYVGHGHLPRGGRRAAGRKIGSRHVDHGADRIVTVRRHQVDRPLGQAVERVESGSHRAA